VVQVEGDKGHHRQRQIAQEKPKDLDQEVEFQFAPNNDTGPQEDRHGDDPPDTDVGPTVLRPDRLGELFGNAGINLGQCG
jgi:hypothetical protein